MTVGGWSRDVYGHVGHPFLLCVQDLPARKPVDELQADRDSMGT